MPSSRAGARWAEFAFWLGQLLVGQAATLQLIDAGRLIRYQHYKGPERLLAETHPVVLAMVVLWVAIVMGGLWRRRREILSWSGTGLRAWRVAVAVPLLLVASAAGSHDTGRYLWEVLVGGALQLVSLATLVLVVLSLPDGAVTKRTGAATSWPVGGIALAAAGWVTLAAGLLSAFVYGRHPHIPDEVMYLFQARYLAEGSLTVPSPPVPEAFSLYLVPYAAERWYSPFPPGWPALLAVGVWLGVPWLVNPVLGGVNVLLTYAFVREILSLRAARLSVLLLCASPWYVFMAMNFMAHTFTLTCALLACLGVVWARRTGNARWGCLAGAGVGAVSLIRPLDGLVVGGLLGLWALGLGGARLRGRCLAAFGASAALVGALVLPYNRAITGDPLTFPLVAYYETYFGPKSNALGFGPERGLGWALDAFPGHTPLEALINNALNLFSVNVELFGWSTGSLILAALFLCSGRLSRADKLMLVAMAAVVGVYSLYWFNGGPDFGARYWFLMLVPLVVLTVRGAERLSEVAGPGRVTVGVLALCVLALVNYFPWRAIDKYQNYLNMRPDIRRLAAEHGFGKSVVLVRGQRHPDYASAWTYNPLDPRADAPVYAWDGDPEARARVLRAYADRPLWIVEGPTVTGGPFRIVAGPLTAGLLERGAADGLR